MCQWMKNHPQQPFGPLMPNKVPNRPWKIISTDLITQLPESNGYNAICVIVDRLTKRAHFIPINNQFSSKDMAQLLYDRIYILYIGYLCKLSQIEKYNIQLNSSKNSVNYWE